MLGTFAKTFPQVATSEGYFHKWKLPNCAISQAGHVSPLVHPSRNAKPPSPFPSHSTRPPLQPAAT